MTTASLKNIHVIERVLRLFIGFSFIASVFFIPAPFDYLIILPLLAIYPCLTAMVGWDPVYYLADVSQENTSFIIDITPLRNTGNAYLTPEYG